MRRTLCLSLALSFICHFGLAATMEVHHEKVLVRSAPQPFAKKTFVLNYKDRVDVKETRGAWVQVAHPVSGQTGWALAASLKKSTFSLGGSTARVGSADRTEIAAAGKGFTAEIESGLKQKNAALDFTWVDKMETWRIKEDRMVRFLKEGKLYAGEAAQ